MENAQPAATTTLIIPPTTQAPQKYLLYPRHGGVGVRLVSISEAFLKHQKH